MVARANGRTAILLVRVRRTTAAWAWLLPLAPDASPQHDVVRLWLPAAARIQR
jgi:hypothetical protein